MGPTASGKTALAVELVRHLPCDIISVDSAMVYRGMDIGTAKPDVDILTQAPHRLLDIRDPAEIYSVAQFRIDAMQEIRAIIAKGRIPLLVGGTMLYFRALQQGLSELPQGDVKLRAELLEEATQYGWQVLHDRLRHRDPLAAERIHPNDPQRLLRALEIYELTGKGPTEHYAVPLGNEESSYHFVNLILTPNDRSILHKHIADRFQVMLQQGFVAEVEHFFLRNDISADTSAMRAVGYRQVWDYLAGQCSYTTMQERAIIATRQLAKRQLTWLRAWPDATWLENDAADLLNKTVSKISFLMNE